VPSFPTLQLEKFTDELHGLTEQSMVSMWNTRAMAVRALAWVLDHQLIPRPFARPCLFCLTVVQEELMKPEMRVRMLSFCQTVAKFRGHLIEGEMKDDS